MRRSAHRLMDMKRIIAGAVIALLLASAIAVSTTAVAQHERHQASCHSRRGEGVPRRSEPRAARADQRGEPRRLDPVHLHHPRHRDHGGAGERSAGQRADRLRERGVPLRQGRRCRRIERRQLDVLKNSLTMSAPPDPKEAEELTRLVASMEGAYGSGKYCPQARDPDRQRTAARKGLPRHREDQRDPLREPRSEAAAGGLGRLAHHLGADEEGLRAVRRAVEQGRQRARLQGHRRDVARQVRHAGRRVREGAGSAVGAAAAALPVAARLHAHQAAREVRRCRARERADPGAPARQSLAAGLVQHLRPRRAGRRARRRSR